MRRAIALIDGEHYPPVVRFALEELAVDYDISAAVFLGGAEKMGQRSAGGDAYGVELFTAEDPLDALARALVQHRPEVVVDLSDEPVISSADRFRFATAALRAGADYRGADFVFSGWSEYSPKTPTLGVIGTGKRVGKTAISAFLARELKRSGHDPVVLAMGRGGPAEPELIYGERVELTTADLLALAEQGVHAASDNYEDAVMSRVTTVGCRRCGGGIAGRTFVSNVEDGARLADTLGKAVMVVEGSGAAIPPVRADATVLVIGAAQGAGAVRDYFGPFRLARADLAVIASAEPPSASFAEVDSIRDEIARLRPDLPVVAATFRPVPLEPIAGRRVLFVATAPPKVTAVLAEHLADEHDCVVVGVSSNLADRAALRADLESAAGTYDTIVTELKAAAIDVVGAAGSDAGIPVVLCDNVPRAVDGIDLVATVEAIGDLTISRGRRRTTGILR